jgi:hypothetical protein
MSDRENFEKWFKQPLGRLWKEDHTGFVILMITLPLLERLLRELSGIGNRRNLNEDDQFYKALVDLLSPEITELKVAKIFWNVYRNGLLHQATLKLSDEVNSIGVHQNEGMPVITAEEEVGGGWNFRVKPVEFSQRVLTAIEADFPTFADAATSPDHPLASVTGTPGFSGASRPPFKTS